MHTYRLYRGNGKTDFEFVCLYMTREFLGLIFRAPPPVPVIMAPTSAYIRIYHYSYDGWSRDQNEIGHTGRE
jgi:hypothetical protein